VNYLGPSLRRARKRSRPWRRGALALLIALLVNGFALRTIHVDSFSGRPRMAQAPRSVTLTPLSAGQWEANRRATQTAPQPQGPTPMVRAPPPPPPNKVPGQVVDAAPSKNATPPKDSRFFAEQNSTVEKETRSRYAKPGYENTLPKPSNPNQPKQTRPKDRGPQLAAGSAGQNGAKTAGPGRQPPAAKGSPHVPEQAPRERLALKHGPRGDLRVGEQRPEARGTPGGQALALLTPPQRQGEEGQRSAPGKEGLPGQAQLRPSAADYEHLSGGPAPDKLDGVEEGEGTYLNTREWKYASYFNRIKQAVATQWDPNGALVKRDPTGQRYAYKDRLTVLTVTLDDKGALKDVHVQRSSGVDFLDSTAIEAFRKAQPFVNPPGGLADQRGEIAFVFGFYLEVGSGLHIFRGAAPP
jgi:TonB family protein